MRGVKEKVKFPLWIRPDIMEQVRAAYAEDDCRSQSEYIEKAIKFYLAYKTTEQKDSFLPSVFLSEIRGILSESDHRHASMLFKLSVEMAMLMNIVVAMQDILPTKPPVPRGDGLPLPPRAEQQGRHLFSVHPNRFPRHRSVRSHRQARHPGPHRRRLAAKRTPSPKKRGKEQ